VALEGTGVVEIAPGGDLRPVEAGQARGEGGGAGAEPALDAPVGGGREGHPLTLALDDDAGGDGLDTPGGEAGLDLAPQDRRDLVTVEAVEDAAGLLRVDEVEVDVAGVLDGALDRLPGDLVEDHPPDRDLRLERLEEVPGDGLALSVLIGGEVEGVDVLEQAPE